MRLTREKIANGKRKTKKLEKERKAKVLSFLTADEIQRRKDWEEGILIRDRHGFDKNSFKGDPYHGQQRKNNVPVV